MCGNGIAMSLFFRRILGPLIFCWAPNNFLLGAQLAPGEKRLVCIPEIPSKGTSPFTPMGEITVDPNGVLKLLNNLKIHKAPWPDGLSARVLKECSSEIAHILALIYNDILPIVIL